MKLIRYGTPGRERVAVLADKGLTVDVQETIDQHGSSWLSPPGLQGIGDAARSRAATVEPRGGGQDGQLLARRTSSRALPHLNREPATPRANRRPDGASVSSGRRDPAPPASHSETNRAERTADWETGGRKWSTRSAERQIDRWRPPSYPRPTRSVARFANIFNRHPGAQHLGE